MFKITADGALTTLHSFTGGNDGGDPVAALAQGSDGNFYGTTYEGGTNFGGTVFKIDANGVLTTLYSFTGGITLILQGNEGAHPNTALVQGGDGYLYGTTYGAPAGVNSLAPGFPGTVFKISTNGSLTSLYSFGGGHEGGNPAGSLVLGSDGNFYGTTSTGGTYGSGTVFEISANGSLTALCSFTGDNDGGWPSAGLMQGSDGYFYGTTEGTLPTGALQPVDYVSYGTVFKMAADGELMTLYYFGTLTNAFGNPLDGMYPQAGLVPGADGNLYGTTPGYWIYNYGTVFKITTNGALSVLYSFTGGNDGAGPSAGLAQGSDGYFYGATSSGGKTNLNGGSGYGTVFKISANGLLTTLHAFTGGNDGGEPGALVQGGDGNVYGTTGQGGRNNSGTVFKISANGSLTTLYAFTGGDDGSGPGGLVEGSNANFYGTTSNGGRYGRPSGFGTVFEISTNGSLTTLHEFTGGNDGFQPGDLARGGNGNFYGVASGALFQITPAGALTTLVSGIDSTAPLVQGTDGSFYGTTHGGGLGGAGTVFRLTIVPEPPLNIIPFGADVIMTWPTNYAGFDYSGYTLQSSTNLGSSAVWKPVSPNPVVIGGQNVVVGPIAGTQQFFRLSR